MCKGWFHMENCQLHAQFSVLPTRIPAVYQMDLGGIRNGKSSFLQEEQQVSSVKNGLQAVDFPQTSEV